MNQDMNGDKDKVKTALRGGTSAAVSTLWDQFKAANAMTDSPQAGDIVIYKNGTSHTGIVEAVDEDGKIHTIEGNTSGGNGYDRNGGMVARKEFYTKDRPGLTGFGRPNWDAIAPCQSSGNNGMPSDVPAAAGSGLTIRSYSDMCKSGGSSGLLLKARPSQMNANVRNASKSLGEARKYYGGDSSLATDATQLLTNLRNTTNLGSKSGSISPETVTKLLESITKLLNNISNNTAPVEKIYNVLTQYLSKSGGDSDLPKTTKPKGNSSTGDHSRIASGEVDQSIQSLAGVLAELAKG